MSLSVELKQYVRACFAGLWVRSHEHDDALTEIAQLCREEKWSLATWDIDRGLHVAGAEAASGATDPLAAIRSLATLHQSEQPKMLVLMNFHRFLSSAEVVQALAHQIAVGKQQRAFVVILSPLVQIPTELEKLFVVLEHELPNREELLEIARTVATEEGELPNTHELAQVLDAAAGLTRFEAEGAFSLSLVRHFALEPECIWELKAGALKKQGLISLHQGPEHFDDLGGLGALKRFCTRALGSRCPRAKPRGALLLGVPGTGKSAFAKALGNELSRPTLILDVGALYGSLVGQTEQNIRQALKIAEAMAPCVLFIDEVRCVG